MQNEIFAAEHIKSLEMVGITKRFPGVLAYDNVNLHVNEGEV